MKKAAIFGFLFISLSSFVVSNKSSFSDTIRQLLSNYTAKDWPEKVYVHTDKPFYTPDEDLWFSVYLVNGITHKRSSKSAVVYIELIDDANSIVDYKRLYIEDLSSGGHFKIDKSWPPGRYLLRAFTNYMRNDDPQTFFQKEIEIVPIDAEAGITAEGSTSNDYTITELNKPALHFYPEGGYLVENLTSKIAIKLPNPIFHSKPLTIEIVDSEGSFLSKFESTNFGMGFFYLKPLPGKSYFANLLFNGQVHQYPLPEVLTNGYGINTNFNKDDLLIGLSSNTINGLKNAYLVMHQRGRIIFDKAYRSERDTDLVSLDTKTLGDGVIHITLFNGNAQPVCERLVYINNRVNRAAVIVNNNKTVSEKREKVTLNLQLKDSYGADLSGNLSMAVRDLDALPENKHASNIKTWLLLNSDLRGKIDNPGYFFSKGNSTKKMFLLDLVMMTNGWRRFSWQNILNSKKKTPQFNPEKGITISGRTKLLESPDQEVASINTISFLSKESVGMESKNSKKDGSFSFGPYIFYDSIPTLIQSKIADNTIKNDKNYRDVLISIDPNAYKSPAIERNLAHKSSNQSLKPNAEYIEISNYIRSLNIEYDEERQRLDEIVLTAKIKTEKEKREEVMEERSYFGGATRRVDMSSDGFLSITDIQYVFQRFPGVTIGARALYYRGEPCRILFNDLPVDLDFIKTLNPSDISFIDFYSPNNAVYNLSQSPGGAFVVYGKKGIEVNSIKTPRQPGIISFTSIGFDSTKEFYAPDYSKDLDQMTRTDLRTTLHWNPKIRLNKEQPQQQISFYTSDLSSSYLIEIEGLTDSGIPVHKIAYFSVN